MTEHLWKPRDLPILEAIADIEKERPGLEHHLRGQVKPEVG